MNGPATFRDQYGLSQGIAAPHNAVFRRENDDEGSGGIRNCGRRDVADLLPADDPIAEPPRPSRILWQWLRSGWWRLWRQRRPEPSSLVRWRPFSSGCFGQSD